MYRPEDFAGPRACGDLTELAAIGWLPGTDRAGPPTYLDPIEDPQMRPEGESSQGVALTRHPDALLREHPELWRVYDRWRVGVRRDLTLAEYDRSSNFEIEAWNVLRGAATRQELRDLKTPREEDSANG